MIQEQVSTPFRLIEKVKYFYEEHFKNKCVLSVGRYLFGLFWWILENNSKQTLENHKPYILLDFATVCTLKNVWNIYLLHTANKHQNEI